MNSRLSWINYFINQTILISSRSTCLRRKVGAILVKNNRIIASGYNGPPPGLSHCTDRGGCLREQLKVPSGERHEICRALHAEQNCIIQCAIVGASAEGSTLFSTTYPCVICTKMLIAAKISKIYCLTKYPDKLSSELLQEANIEVEFIDIDARNFSETMIDIFSKV